MPVYALGDQVPNIHPDAFVHPDAVVIGCVTIGAGSSVWGGAVLRGDEGGITVGARTSIHADCVLHTSAEDPTVVGDDCVIEERVHLEGCTIESGCLIGNRAILLHRAAIGSGAVVAASAVLLDDTVVPSGASASGVPAVVELGGARPEVIAASIEADAQKVARYRASRAEVPAVG
jgi:carbonic anhydrase/acetyltransferase-like protein (isoleucine patch superfamily)